MSRVWRGLVGIAVLWLPILAGRDAVSFAASLTTLAESPNPYLVPGHAVLLYLWVPLVLASAGIALLTPGLVCTVDSRGHGDAAWLARGFAVSLLLVSGATSLVQVGLGITIRGGAFLALLAGLSVLAVAWRLGWRRTQTQRACEHPLDAVLLSAAIVVPMVLAAVMSPKWLWESFNGDGAHAFETARLAVRQFVPFWDPAAGDVAFFPGMSTVLFAYPASWFLRLFGDLEVSVRAPYLLVLVAVHAGIVGLATLGRGRVAASGIWLTWLALSVYTVVQAYSATYDPYSADISMPGLPDTLQMAVLLGAFHAYLSRQWGWLAAFLLLTLMASPAGLSLFVFWLGAIAVSAGRGEWSAARRGALLLVGAMVVLAAVPWVLGILSLPAPGKEHGVLGLLGRFAFLQFTDWRRLLWVVVPAGIFPFVTVLAWRRLDAVGRALWLVAAGHFAMFFVQAHVMIHHFAPVMLIPIAAAWRMTPWPWAGRRAWLAAALGSVALWASLPVNAAPVTAARQVGRAIADRAGGYDELAPANFSRSEMLSALFPKDHDPRVPAVTYGGSPLAWNHYAQRDERVAADTAYVLTLIGVPAPAGAEPVAASASGALYVQDREALTRHQALRPPTPAGSRLYWTPRGVLFRSVPLEGGPWILDVPAWLERAGVDVAGVKQRFENAR